MNTGLGSRQHYLNRQLCWTALYRGCLQTQVWKAKGLLFSLSDDGVNAHHVPAFKLACQAGRSRGANQFAFDETRAMLCVAAKRRLILSHYNGTSHRARLQAQLLSQVITVKLILAAGAFSEVRGLLSDRRSCGKNFEDWSLTAEGGLELLTQRRITQIRFCFILEVECGYVLLAELDTVWHDCPSDVDVICNWRLT